MDRFNLQWPSTDATFYTDGWRCRIVWRQKGGIGGTIDNNDRCVQRVADSLDGAPYLLSALKARGHGRLATQIETLASAEPEPPAAEVASTKREEPRKVEKKPSEKDRLAQWLGKLTGPAEFESAASRRAKTWHEIGPLKDAEELVFLKPPAARGKQEWVLKRTWSGEKRKAEYVIAVSLSGICRFLVESGANTDVIERLLVCCQSVDHEELATAASAWRAVTDSQTH